MDALTIAAPTTPGFLADWREDHRALDEAARTAAGAYIQAIVKVDRVARLLGPVAIEARASALWMAFRESYDGMRGPFMKSNEEDARRALARL